LAFGDGSIGHDEGFDRQPTVIQPSSLPAFTGTLEVHSPGEESNSLHQSTVVASGTEFEVWRCLVDSSIGGGLCSALESLEIQCGRAGTFVWHLPPYQLLISVRRCVVSCRWLITRSGGFVRRGRCDIVVVAQEPEIPV
jgi:hypothetical protein